ncbi:serine/threonine-protein kinase [Polyangium sp. 6x1]|uniref:serine/threonine-protein kinase n=1 Tax=Polyangium sp. 6x1 TaxID=3042689 RepID=UPI002482E09A|nr:serine/threonine-protein kinase [Polyangium sp. 6x1]MDI1445357.1 serine/threonine-protein kinase [Polyangium sp. 6x1]
MRPRVDELAPTFPGADAPSSAAQPEPADAEILVASAFRDLVIGRFSVLRKLGEGGMGEVFVAYDEQLDRRVAIKLVHATVAESEQAQRRFMREAQALARLSHPNVVALYEVGVFGGRVYLAMEYVDGVTLRDWQDAPGRTQDEIVACYAQAARGLRAAHEAGIVHRDFKPQNAIVGKDGRVRILDFGIAFAGAGEASATRDPAVKPAPIPQGDAKLTETGALVGTPAYMSPEQILRDPVDARSDQWSFCVALYEALYRVHPFGTEWTKLFGNVLEGRVAPPPERDIHSPRLHAALLRGLSTNPADRFADMNGLIEVLEQDPTTDPAAQGRSRLVFALATTTMVVIWSGRRFFHAGPTPAPPPPKLVMMALCVLGVFGVGVAVFRKTLLRNQFHRTMVGTLGVLLAGVLASRSMGLLHGEPTDLLMRREVYMLAVGTPLFAFLSGVRSPFLWLPTLPVLGGLLLLFLDARPGAGFNAISIAMNGSMIAFVVLWTDVSRRVRRGAQMEGSTVDTAAAGKSPTSLKV